MSHTITLSFPTFAQAAKLQRNVAIPEPMVPTCAAGAPSIRAEQKFGEALAEMISNLAAYTFVAGIMTWMTVIVVSMM
jgi:hypothetical protein